MTFRIISKCCTLLVWVVLVLESTTAQTMYVLTEMWGVHVFDMQRLAKVDSFEVIQPNPPLIEERGEMNIAEYVPQKNLLFVSNTEGGPTEGGPAGLKIMKVDLATKTSTVFFRDRELTTGPVHSSLMPASGDYYYEIEDDLLYAHYYETVFVLDMGGNIVNTFQDVPYLAIDQSYPRFGKKLYRLGTKSLVEFDLTTCRSRKVLANLPWIGGEPFSGGGTMKFLSQTSTTADILIADRKTYRLGVDKDTPPGSAEWTIREQEQWSYMIPGEPLGDIAGYKSFEGQLLTVTPPGQGDFRFWVFDPARGPNMPLVYLVNLPPPDIIWQGVPDPPQEIVEPVARLVPGTNMVVATYGGAKRFNRFRLVVINAETGEQLKIFDMYLGEAAVLFK